MKKWLAIIMLLLFSIGSLFGSISCKKKETETEAEKRAKEQYPGLFGEEENK
jgi:Sec-independent protein secretion pathway component TatC